ncbi:AAA family ATPase [Rhizobium leguminosarum]|uniref:AAA family ATPase n=1 Tax=Rhizobium leguminosarum TaxID=384 RepID=UPI00103B30EC|nr:AAA family ATPase [Rhizobium leguminosarum]TBZ70216.1 hypothetical protein E0H61_31350 [Rhizobium leguminosarum bv. viciae]TBZ89812.1 hypothetical protein E0H56_23155 [Rhizobium leguminosarum bv. viciae]
MRRISRRRVPPSFLSSGAVVQEKQRILDYLRREPEDRRSRRANLNESLFFDDSFRSALLNAFSGTCAFCETDISSDLEFSDDFRVTQFRPPRYVDDPGVDKDYYLWLAFEWQNLYAACAYCEKARRDRFPVKGKRAPFLASYTETNRHERRLLVDPCQDDPRKHITFRMNGTAEALTEQGYTTINVFELNRQQLLDTRRIRIREMFDEVENSWNLGHLVFSPLRAGSPHAGALTQIWRRLGNETNLLPPIVMRASAHQFPGRLLIHLQGLSDPERRRLQEAISEARARDDLDPPREITPEWGEQSSGSSAQSSEPVRFFAARDEIRSIVVSDYKVLDHLELRLPSSRRERSGAPCLMILGENSTGKSSILAAAALALIGEKESRKLAKFLPAAVRSNNRDRMDQLDESPVAAHVTFHRNKRRAFFTFRPSTNTVIGDQQATVVLGYGPRRYFDPKKREYPAGAAARVKTLFDPLATIPYPDEWLSNRLNSQFDTIAGALREVLAMEEDDELVREGGNILVRANGRVTPIDALSEGYRSVFTMTADMLREFSQHWSNLEQAQGVVLIDEIETHLHPRWKMQVMSSLRRVLPRVQFIATTHDPLCLRGMDDGEVVVLQRDEGKEVRQLKDLPSIRGMTAEQLLTSDYFGLASTADPQLELGLLKETNDYAYRTGSGRVSVQVSDRTKSMLQRLSLGDTPSEQIMQDALEKYLAERETPGGTSRSQLRAEAVQAVVAALRKIT